MVSDSTPEKFLCRACIAYERCFYFMFIAFGTQQSDVLNQTHNQVMVPQYEETTKHRLSDGSMSLSRFSYL